LTELQPKGHEVFEINERCLLGLVLAAVFAVIAAIPAVATAASPCRVLTVGTSSQGVGTETCSEPPGVSPSESTDLREVGDGTETTPISTDFPTDALLSNTKAEVRWSMNIGGVKVRNLTPAGYAFLALKLEGNPVSSAKACRVATGTIPWVGVLDSSPSAVFAGNTAWTFSIDSNSTACAAENRGKVTIHNVGVLFETLGTGKAPIVATGTLTGVYEQPGANCPAGGVKLSASQPGITTEPASGSAVEVDNGTTGSSAYACFVAANNYLFPSKAPTWKLTGGTGIWKD
jgi:hypothetical protein